MTDPIDTALLPCPFCGGDADVMVSEDDNTPAAIVMCMDCYIVGPERGTEAEAIAAWNTRTASQADTARQEGIALGVAMAKAAPRYSVYIEEGDIDPAPDGEWIKHADIPEPPIPPHVAAARVLLRYAEEMSSPQHGNVSTAMFDADDMDGGYMDMLRAALEQIAKEGG